MNKLSFLHFAMRKAKLLFALLFFTSTLVGEHYDREVVVPLSTKRELENIYIGSFQNFDSPYSNEYLTELRKVLVFDLNNNGSMFTLNQGVEADKLLQSANPFAIDFWKRRNAEYILKTEVTNDKLLFTLFSTKTGQSYRAKRPLISGKLASDRRVMHEIADLIYESATGLQGIASSRIFYAIQVPEESKGETAWKSEIWESDYDGENKRQITQEGSYSISPALFPKTSALSKSQFLYVNYVQGQPKIYITSFDQPKGTPWVSLRGNQLLPTVSPLGNMIAFISDASGRADLFVQPVSQNDGILSKPIRVFSYPNSVQASPTFSPDGKKIAFVSDKDGTPHVYLIDTPVPGMEKMPKPQRLTNEYRENTCPAWSPDGTKLAYSAKVDGIRQIMVYDIITKDEMQLTFSRVHKENPSWAPNSFHLVYNTVDDASSELFLINLKQKKAVQITKGHGKKHYPAWEMR